MAPKDDDDSIKTTPAANVISNSATRDMAQRASEQNPFYAGNVEASSTTGTSMALTYSRKLGYRTKEQEEYSKHYDNEKYNTFFHTLLYPP